MGFISFFYLERIKHQRAKVMTKRLAMKVHVYVYLKDIYKLFLCSFL